MEEPTEAEEVVPPVRSTFAMWPFALSMVAMVLALLAHKFETELAPYVAQAKEMAIEAWAFASAELAPYVAKGKEMAAEKWALAYPHLVRMWEMAVEMAVNAFATATKEGKAALAKRGVTFDKAAPTPARQKKATGGRAATPAAMPNADSTAYRISTDPTTGSLIATPVRRSKRRDAGGLHVEDESGKKVRAVAA